jgi:hypothetical protein
VRALQLDPLLWVAFVELCSLGESQWAQLLWCWHVLSAPCVALPKHSLLTHTNLCTAARRLLGWIEQASQPRLHSFATLRC